MRPRIDLGAFIGGITVLAVTLGLTLPTGRKMVEGFGEGNRARVLLVIVPSVCVIVFSTQAAYWALLLPLLRWLRIPRRSKS